MTNNGSVTQLHGLTPEELMASFKEVLRGELKAILEEITPNDRQKYLTRKQVAEMLNVNLSTIHSWSKSGKLKPYGIGNRVYFLKEDIVEALTPLSL